MSKGTGALNVGRGPEHFRPRAGRYPWQPREREPPLQAAANWHRHTELDQWKNTHLTPHTYQKGLKHLTRREGSGLKSLLLCKLTCKDQHESAKTR